MKKHTQILSWGIIGIIMASQTFSFAQAEDVMPILISAPTQANDEYIPPVELNNTTYEFDKTQLKLDKPGLYKITCDNEALFKKLGIDGKKGFTAIEYKEGDYVYRGDFRSCSLGAWKEEDTTGIDWKKNRITEKDALAKAAEFLAKNKIEEVTFKLGTPVVTAKMTDSPVVYAEASASADAKVAATTEETKKDDGKYISVTVVYPITLGGKTLRTSWDDPVGVSITVDGRGIVTNLNATTKFTLKKRTSDVMTQDELAAYIKRGGNNGYYPMNGGASTVKLDKIEKSFVLFNYYSKGISDQYISTGFRLESSATKVPYNLDKNYAQLVSDYVIGNPSYVPYVK